MSEGLAEALCKLSFSHGKDATSDRLNILNTDLAVQVWIKSEHRREIKKRDEGFILLRLFSKGPDLGNTIDSFN